MEYILKGKIYYENIPLEGTKHAKKSYPWGPGICILQYIGSARLPEHTASCLAKLFTAIMTMKHVEGKL